MYGLGPLYVVKGDGSTLTFARDGSKNVRAELNGSGAVTAAFRYRAYGQLAQSTTPSPTYLGLASQLLDPSGLYYMRARWYDPANGRFVTRDPLRGSASSPMTLNAFAYAGGSPLSATDPSGMSFQSHDEGACQADCDYSPAPARSNWAYAIADVFRDLDSEDTATKLGAFGKVVATGVAIAIPLGIAAAPTVTTIVGGASTATVAEAAGAGPAVAWATQHAGNAARALDVSMNEVSGVIARGTPYWDLAYRNLSVFASRGSGTLQVDQ